MAGFTHELIRRSAGPLLLDGAMATELENRGLQLDEKLWSATLIDSAPESILQLHVDYLTAGCNIITSGSYQASIDGYRSAGWTREQAASLIGKSVQIARESLSSYEQREQAENQPLRPLAVAASVGPYGAVLANGAEYSGEYSIPQRELLHFHRERWAILASAGADLILCETIPNLSELFVLSELAQQFSLPVWVSLSCRDELHLADGTPLADCVDVLQQAANVEAVGVNCLPPHRVSGTLSELRRSTDLPLLTYPNSGETYDAATGKWTERGYCEAQQFAEQSLSWRNAGAAIIGGCCRTTPAHIAALNEKYN